MFISLRLVCLSIITLFLGIAISNRISIPSPWPTAEQDQVVLGAIHEQMADEFGRAWTDHRHLISKTNSAFHEMMLETFQKKLERGLKGEL